jgi:hypothetical protein
MEMRLEPKEMISQLATPELTKLLVSRRDGAGLGADLRRRGMRHSREREGEGGGHFDRDVSLDPFHDSSEAFVGL